MHRVEAQASVRRLPSELIRLVAGTVKIFGKDGDGDEGDEDLKTKPC